MARVRRVRRAGLAVIAFASPAGTSSASLLGTGDLDEGRRPRLGLAWSMSTAPGLVYSPPGSIETRLSASSCPRCRARASRVRLYLRKCEVSEAMMGLLASQLAWWCAGECGCHTGRRHRAWALAGVVSNDGISVGSCSEHGMCAQQGGRQSAGLSCRKPWMASTARRHITQLSFCFTP